MIFQFGLFTGPPKCQKSWRKQLHAIDSLGLCHSASKMLCSITGRRLAWPTPAAPPPAVPPISPRTKPEQMVIKPLSAMAAGASSSPGRPTSCPGILAPAVAHRATSSGSRRVARRRRPLHHCRRPGRCRREMRRIQRSHWRPCRGAPRRPSWLMTAGGRCCAHPAQMALAHHGVQHLVSGHTTDIWSPRLIASSTLFVDARRSRKTPRPEKETKVARNCTEKYSVDWRPKSTFEITYLFAKHAPITPLNSERVGRDTLKTREIARLGRLI